MFTLLLIVRQWMRVGSLLVRRGENGHVHWDRASRRWVRRDETVPAAAPTGPGAGPA
jgi:hypothetical protein